MREHGFATLISHGGDGPVASHLPLFFDADRGPLGTLRGHLARSNPHCEALRAVAETLAVFQGPHAYISPNWYESGASVPTWNYAVVHAYGTPRQLEPEALHKHLDELVSVYESGQPRPWSTDALAPDFLEQLEGGIVGFEITITRLEGKWKLGQNRTAADRQGAARHLLESGVAGAAEVARLMQQVDASRG
jgi:transcriptional regulator